LDTPLIRATRIDVQWLDSGREPRNPPNPAFPNGVDLDASEGAVAACLVDLPYPAKRCGMYLVRCEVCGQNAAITTAGRPDDPKSVKIACQLVERQKSN
jgi:hypothetical protein